MRAGQRWGLVLATAVAVMGIGAVAWACVPGSQLRAQPDHGAPGQQATVHGQGFPDRPVEIHWGSSTGPVIATGQGPEFAVGFSVPGVGDGVYTIVAVAHAEESPDGEAKSPPYSRTTRAPFEVASDGTRGSWGDGAWEQGLPDNAGSPGAGDDVTPDPDGTSGSPGDEAAPSQPAPDQEAQPAPDETAGNPGSEPGSEQPGRQHVGPTPASPRVPVGDAPTEGPSTARDPAPPPGRQPRPTPPASAGGDAAGGPSGTSAAPDPSPEQPDEPAADSGDRPDEAAPTDTVEAAPAAERSTSAEALRRKLEARLSDDSARHQASPDDEPVWRGRQDGAERDPGLLSGAAGWGIAFVAVLLALATAFAGLVYRHRPQRARSHAGRRPPRRTKLFGFLLLALAAAVTLPGATSAEPVDAPEDVTARDAFQAPGLRE